MNTAVAGQPVRNSHDSRDRRGRGVARAVGEAAAREVGRGRGREQVHGAQLHAAWRARATASTSARREALAAVVRVDGHAAEQAVLAVHLEAGDADHPAVVLAHHEVVAPALGDVLLRSAPRGRAARARRAGRAVARARPASGMAAILPPLAAPPRRRAAGADGSRPCTPSLAEPRPRSSRGRATAAPRRRALLDQPQHVEGARRARRELGVEVEVDGRERLRRRVEDPGADEAPAASRNTTSSVNGRRPRGGTSRNSSREPLICPSCRASR